MKNGLYSDDFKCAKVVQVEMLSETKYGIEVTYTDESVELLPYPFASKDEAQREIDSVNKIKNRK